MGITFIDCQLHSYVPYSLASQGGKTPTIQFGISILIFTLHSSQDEVLRSHSLLTVDPFVKLPTTVETIQVQEKKVRYYHYDLNF